MTLCRFYKYLQSNCSYPISYLAPCLHEFKYGNKLTAMFLILDLKLLDVNASSILIVSFLALIAFGTLPASFLLFCYDFQNFKWYNNLFFRILFFYRPFFSIIFPQRLLLSETIYNFAVLSPCLADTIKRKATSLNILLYTEGYFSTQMHTSCSILGRHERSINLVYTPYALIFERYKDSKILNIWSLVWSDHFEKHSFFSVC